MKSVRRSSAPANATPSLLRLSKGHDSALAAELKDIGASVDGLWDEHRAVKAELRFGPRENIRKRARAEERLERAA